jgi:hypothetical protein
MPQYKDKQCNDTMTFQECELAILRNAVDENEKITGEKMANSEDVKKMILYHFLKTKEEFILIEILNLNDMIIP